MKYMTVFRKTMEQLMEDYRGRVVRVRPCGSGVYATVWNIPELEAAALKSFYYETGGLNCDDDKWGMV